MPVHSISFFLVSVLTNRAIISKSLRYKASQVAGLEPKNLSHLNKVLARDIAIGGTFIVKALGKHGEEKKKQNQDTEGKCYISKKTTERSKYYE